MCSGLTERCPCKLLFVIVIDQNQVFYYIENAHKAPCFPYEYHLPLMLSQEALYASTKDTFVLTVPKLTQPPPVCAVFLTFSTQDVRLHHFYLFPLHTTVL